ncbi:hypothetical protein LXL04_002550 [Taraxacum kok-saghyz]
MMMMSNRSCNLSRNCCTVGREENPDLMGFGGMKMLFHLLNLSFVVDFISIDTLHRCLTNVNKKIIDVKIPKFLGVVLRRSCKIRQINRQIYVESKSVHVTVPQPGKGR